MGEIVLKWSFNGTSTNKIKQMLNNCLLTFCNIIPNIGESAPCEDKNPDCAEFGQDVCGNSNFQGYLRENCRKFCGYCTGKSLRKSRSYLLKINYFFAI